MASEPANVEVEPEGDLILIAGKERTRIRVSRAAMRRTCRPFDSMLDPSKWLESTKNEIELPDDSAAAMEISARIAHLQFRHIPSSGITLAVLLDVAIATDKYDMSAIMEPFYPNWQKVLHDSDDSKLGDKLYVAFVFKDIEWFKRKAVNCVVRMQVDRDDDSVFLDKAMLGGPSNLYMNPMITKLVKVHHAVEEDLKQLIRTWICYLKENKGCRAPRGTAYQYECNLLLRGSFQEAVKEELFDPTSSPEAIIGVQPCLLEMQERINSIIVTSHGYDSSWRENRAPGPDRPRNHGKHAICGDFSKKLRTEVANL